MGGSGTGAQMHVSMNSLLKANDNIDSFIITEYDFATLIEEILEKQSFLSGY